MAENKGEDELYSWLSDICQPISVRGDDVEVLNEPRHFYEQLCRGIEGAQQSIVIAALYLGTSAMEQSLVHALLTALDRSPNLTVHFLFDYMRGTRGKHSTATMIQPLVERYPTRTRACFYHTPALRGWLRRLLPQPLNELVALQHIKVYAFDDSAIMSGANVSADYFNNRQDRYVVFRHNRPLADYCRRLVAAVSALSFRLGTDGELAWLSDVELHPCDGDASRFTNELAKAVRAANQCGLDEANGPPTDSLVYPLIQMGPHGIVDEEMALARILEEDDSSVRVALATGYFNLTEDYCARILRRGRYELALLTAAPEANGFYGARGPLRFVTDMYTQLLRAFVWRAAEHAPERVTASEFRRDGWTFHAKGLWLSSGDGAPPDATFVGSSNFGARSVQRDLEFGLFLVTTNSTLRAQLEREKRALFAHSLPATVDTFEADQRKLPFWLHYIGSFIRKFL